MNNDSVKTTLMALGLDEAEATKYMAADGTIDSLRETAAGDLATELGISPNRARSIKGALTRAEQNGGTSLDKLAGVLAQALPQDLGNLGLAACWRLYQQDRGRPEVRDRLDVLTRRAGPGSAKLRTFVLVNGVVDPDLSETCLSTLRNKKFVPKKGFRFRGRPVKTLDEALREREYASPLTLRALHDDGEDRLFDDAGVNWKPIMPAPMGNGRAAILVLAQFPCVQAEWGEEPLVPAAMAPRAMVKELRGEGEIGEDSELYRAQMAWDDAWDNARHLCLEAQALLEEPLDPEEQAQAALCRQGGGANPWMGRRA